ncbi:hypothetical protein D3C72_1346350 [compost metagenome]
MVQRHGVAARCPGGLLHRAQLREALLGGEPVPGHHFAALPLGKLLGGRTDHENRPARLHQRLSSDDGVAHGADPCDGAAGQILPTHDAGIHLVGGVRSEHRSTPSIEQRAFLQQAHGLHRYGFCWRAFCQLALRAQQNIAQRIAVRLLLRRRDRCTGDGACAAMDGNDGGELGRTHILIAVSA